MRWSRKGRRRKFSGKCETPSSSYVNDPSKFIIGHKEVRRNVSFVTETSFLGEITKRPRAESPSAFLCLPGGTRGLFRFVRPLTSSVSITAVSADFFRQCGFKPMSMSRALRVHTESLFRFRVAFRNVTDEDLRLEESAEGDRRVLIFVFVFPFSLAVIGAGFFFFRLFRS